MAVHGELSTATLLKLMSFLWWSGMYLHTALNWPEKDPEWSSRMVTLLHGSIATVVGLSQCDLVNLSARRLSMKYSARHYGLMLWSWGYFGFDLVWCLVYQPQNRLNLVHHAMALVAITMHMQKAYTGCTFACNLALLEITNPLLQTRWFLKYEGYLKTPLFYAVEVTYVVMFIFARAIFGSYLVYKIMESQIYDWEEKVMSLIFYVVSLALVYEVMGYVIHRYRPDIEKFLDNRGIILQNE